MVAQPWPKRCGVVKGVDFLVDRTAPLLSGRIFMA
jgi:hypothetical protein